MLTYLLKIVVLEIVLHMQVRNCEDFGLTQMTDKLNLDHSYRTSDMHILLYFHHPILSYEKMMRFEMQLGVNKQLLSLRIRCHLVILEL